MYRVIFFVGVCMAASIVPTSAMIINVPSDYTTIQAGIDASSDGDTVRVAPGTYVENIDFSGKNIVVGSWFLDDGDISYISSTIIDGGSSGNVLLSLLSSITIVGFTIQNGEHGIYASHSGLGINNCIIKNNSGCGAYMGLGVISVSHSTITNNSSYGISGEWDASFDATITNSSITNNGGGGIAGGSYAAILTVQDSHITGNSGAGIGFGFDTGNYISGCTIEDNSGPGIVGGSYDSGYQIENCIIKRNSPGILINRGGGNISYCIIEDNYGDYGGGIKIYEPFFGCTVQNCTIVGNSAIDGGGIHITGCEDECGIYIHNCVIAYNSQSMAVNPWESSINISCTDIYGNEGGDWVGYIANLADSNGNFSAPPRFCDTTSGDYHIAPNSICAPDNNDCNELIGALPVNCDSIFLCLYVDTTGSDSTGDGSEENPFATIQHGIDMASDGDTVLVADGHYYERITFDGKNIVVASEFIDSDSDTMHIQNTVIDGDTSITPVVADTGSVVRFVNGEDSTAMLVGFTIQNGVGTPVYYEYSFSVIEDKGNVVNFINEEYATQEIQELITQNRVDTMVYYELESILRDTDILDDTCGGAILCYDCSPVIQNCIIKDNTAGYGGGIFSYGISHSLTISGCTITHNNAKGGGGVSSAYGWRDFSMTNCRIDSNEAAINGASLYFRLVFGVVSIMNCSISDNSSGGILCHATNLNIDSCTIANNQGNGIFGDNYPVNPFWSYLNIINCTITGNMLIGIYFKGDLTVLNVEDCYIGENGGRGIFITIEAYGDITNSIIENNSGGGIQIDNRSWGVITDCIIRGNSADSGGGIYFSTQYPPTYLFEGDSIRSDGWVSSCHIENNTATYGGGIYCASYISSGGYPFLSNCTIVRNSAQYGSGFFVASIPWSGILLELENCIIAYGSQGEAIGCGDTQESPSLSCCDIFGNEGGDWVDCIEDQAEIYGNFSLDPAFCDTANSNYHIASNSPCAPDNNSCDTLIGVFDIGCSGFNLITPATDSIYLDTPSEFIWQHTDDVNFGYPVFYRFYIDDNVEFDSPDSSEILSDTTYSLSDTLNRSMQYFWRVLAFNDYMDSTFSDETWNLYIDGYPTMPTIIAPTNGAEVNSSTYLVWLISADPDPMDTVTYTLQVDDDSEFNSPEIDVSGITNIGLVSDEAVAVMLGDLDGFENLQDGQIYYWRVRSDDKFGLSSEFTDGSNYFSFGVEEIPTLNEWGMVILALLLLASGTVAVVRRRRVVTIEGRQ